MWGAGLAMEPAGTETELPAGPDSELWRRAAGGDRSAFGELFERHVRAVWNHAYRLTGSWSLAEDITSAAFLTAWRRRAEITLVRDSALPWLYAVVGNLARSEQRSSIRFLRAVRRLPAAGADQDHADAVADRIGDDQRLRVVLDAIRALPRSERQAVEMCLVGGLPIADAAAALGISEVSVRSRISRARGRLRTVVKEES
jgi:RNA polymerase sigma factor (sigma-70 family)